MSEPLLDSAEKWEFRTHDGLKIQAFSSSTVDKVKAHVLIIHGLVEHAGRYKHVVKTFTERGFAVHMMDLRGHGKSEGVRGYINTFSDYVSDIKRFHAMVRSKFPGEKLFLLGHSLGGLIVTSYVILQQAELSGIILSGAGLKLGPNFPKILVFLAPFIAKWFPLIRIAKVNPKYISQDPHVVKAYIQDPLVFMKGPPAKTGSEGLLAIERVQTCMEEFRLPVLILHGADDKIAEPDGSKDLFERASSTDKSFRLYPGLYHEIFNEPSKEEILAEVIHWLEERIGG